MSVLISKTMSYINIHTHQLQKETIIFIYNAENINFFCYFMGNISYGIHPWNVSSFDINIELRNIEDLIISRKIVALGECGLDRCITTPLQLQIQVFEQQLRLAQKYQIPAIIHCVKCYNEIIKIVKDLKLSIPLIIHGYNANSIITRRLLTYKNIYFSFGKLLITNIQKSTELLDIISMEKIFFETDDDPIAIETIYKCASEIKKIPEDVLILQVYNNFIKLFENNV
ncbi:MAG: TatD family hydrolase [Bacteroidales bacterium]